MKNLKLMIIGGLAGAALTEFGRLVARKVKEIQEEKEMETIEENEE